MIKLGKFLIICALLGVFGIVFADVKTYIASNNLIFSSDSEVWGDSESYQKLKEIEIDGNGTIRVSFDLKGVDGALVNVFGKVYINNNPVGIEREIVADGTYHTFTEDFSVSNNDLIQLFAKTQPTGAPLVKNFRIYADEVLPAISLYSLPMASTSDMLASVGTLFTDLWVMIVLAIGLPLAFYVIKRVIRLTPAK